MHLAGLGGFVVYLNQRFDPRQAKIIRRREADRDDIIGPDAGLGRRGLDRDRWWIVGPGDDCPRALVAVGQTIIVDELDGVAAARANGELGLVRVGLGERA